MRVYPGAPWGNLIPETLGFRRLSSGWISVWEELGALSSHAGPVHEALPGGGVPLRPPESTRSLWHQTWDGQFGSWDTVSEKSDG